MRLLSLIFAIMKIGGRGYRWTPWWCWGVAFLLAITVLPGETMRISADDGPNVPYRATSSEPVPYSLDANAAPVNSGLGAGVSALGNKTPPDTVYYTKSYFVKDVLSRLQKENGYSEPAAKKVAQSFARDSIANSMAGPAGNQHNRPQPEQVRWLKDSDDLVVGATNAGHKRVADTLDALRKYGTLDQIAIETRFVVIPNDELQQVLPDWSPSTVGEAALANSNAVWPASFDRPLDSHEGTCVARAQLLTEKNPPVRFRIMNKDQGENLIERCQNNARSNILQAPKVTVFNGQTACVSDIAQSPFVVGVAPVKGQEATGARQPQTRVVTEGTMLQLRPTADQSGAIHLDFAATFSKIQKVDTVNITPASANGTTLQIPEVATVRMEGGAMLKPGQWLLLGGSDTANQMTAIKVAPVSWKDWLLGGGKRQKQPQTQELFLMLRAEKIQLARDKANRESPVSEHE